jgi:hypothetical protein
MDDIRFDFSLKNGTVLGALIRFLVVLTVFIIIPYAVFTFVSGSLSDMGGDIFEGADMTDQAWEWVSNMMKYAIPLILLSIPIGFYRPGSYARIPFKILFALYLGSWLWISSNGGIFSLTLPDMSFMADSVSSITVNLDMRYVVYVMMMICFAMVFLAFTEFGGNRKKYFEALEKKKDTMSKRKARRLSG